MFLLQLFDLITAATVRWLAEVEGKAVGELVRSIRGASIQLDVARGLIESAERPEVSAADRARLIKIAQGLAEGSRASVRSAAAGVALAVPREVEEAFDNFGAAAANAAGRLGQQAKETLLGWALIAAVFVWFWLERREGRA